jgi:hypothetical protein
MKRGGETELKAIPGKSVHGKPFSVTSVYIFYIGSWEKRGKGRRGWTIETAFQNAIRAIGIVSHEPEKTYGTMEGAGLGPIVEQSPGLLYLFEKNISISTFMRRDPPFDRAAVKMLSRSDRICETSRIRQQDLLPGRRRSRDARFREPSPRSRPDFSGNSPLMR